MSKKEREKGKRGERLWANICREHGYTEVRRTAQYYGKTGDASDCVGLPAYIKKLSLLSVLIYVTL